MPGRRVVALDVPGEHGDRPRDVLVVVRIRTARGRLVHAWRVRDKHWQFKAFSSMWE
jgi:hypothetical protein